MSDIIKTEFILFHMEMIKLSYISEQKLENQLISHLVNMGYEKVSIHDECSLFLNFKKQIEILNYEVLKGQELSEQEFRILKSRILNKGVFKSAKELRQKQAINLDDGTEIYLQLFSTNPKDNSYQVTNQITVYSKRVNRYDVTILINGLPIVQIELKKPGIDLYEAYKQIDRYKIESYVGLFRFIQVFVISAGSLTKYLSNKEGKLDYNFSFSWADKENSKINDIFDFSSVFFEKSFITKLIADYIVINDVHKSLMVMRPYQIHAVEALLTQASSVKKNGYIFHATGSGKTMTSFKFSQLISNYPNIDKVIFLVDRKDLNKQTKEKFNSYEPGSVDFTSDTKSLIKQLKEIERKLVITTINKMNVAVTKSKYSKTMETFKQKNVVFVIDECHRSQFGKMHQQIISHFENSLLFGFTGTPIFEETANFFATGNLFGEQLHHYYIKDGIADHNILPFNIQYFKTAKLKTTASDEDVTSIDKKEVIESNERIEKIVKHINSIHDKLTCNRKYNAILCVPSVKSAIRYYNQFKEMETDLTVATIFTWDPNGKPDENGMIPRDSLEQSIKEYNNVFNTEYSTDSYDKYFSDVSDRLTKGEIDILIVVKMFLTGYDSPSLNTLYVDRKLRYHELVQTFSRTNRIQSKVKKYGNIVSYLTKKDDVDEALKMYNDDSSIDFVVVHEYEYYREIAIKNISSFREIIMSVNHAANLRSENEKKEFLIRFRRIVRVLNRLKHYVEFEFTQDEIGMGEKEYNNFRTIYLALREKSTDDPTSVINDFDFDIELIHTDLINVDYILQQIAKITIGVDKDIMQDEIERINELINNNTTALSKSKLDLLREFMNEILPKLTSEDVILEEYYKYLAKKKEEVIYEFSNNVGIEQMILKELLDEYNILTTISNSKIRNNLTCGFLDKSANIKKVKDFITDFTKNYS